MGFLNFEIRKQVSLNMVTAIVEDVVQGLSWGNLELKSWLLAAVGSGRWKVVEFQVFGCEAQILCLLPKAFGLELLGFNMLHTIRYRSCWFMVRCSRGRSRLGEYNSLLSKVMVLEC